MQSIHTRERHIASPHTASDPSHRAASERSALADDMIITGDDTVRISLSERARDLAEEAGAAAGRGQESSAPTPQQPAPAASATSAEEALSILAQSGVAELRFLRVDEDETQICLSGCVRSFYHKQLAQEAIRPIAAGRQLINRVDVALG